MYPIIGDRYKCKDCLEEVGFDLCGNCYNTRSKRPGRFNQQHKPEHKFHLLRPQMFPNLRLGVVTEMLEEGSTTFVIANDEDSESSDDIGAILELSSDARESDEDDSDVDGRTQTNSNDNRIDLNYSQPS